MCQDSDKESDHESYSGQGAEVIDGELDFEKLTSGSRILYFHVNGRLACLHIPPPGALNRWMQTQKKEQISEFPLTLYQTSHRQTEELQELPTRFKKPPAPPRPRRAPPPRPDQAQIQPKKRSESPKQIDLEESDETGNKKKKTKRSVKERCCIS